MTEPASLDEALRLYGEARWYWQEWEEQRRLFDLLPRELWQAVIPAWEPVATRLMDEWFSRVRQYEEHTGRSYLEEQQPDPARERAAAERAQLIFPGLRRTRAAQLLRERAALCASRRTFWGLTLEEWRERDARVWGWLDEASRDREESLGDERSGSGDGAAESEDPGR